MNQPIQQHKQQPLLDDAGLLRAHAYVVEQLNLLTVAELKKLDPILGISWRTMQKIRSGEIVDPGVGNIEKLANFFVQNERKPVGAS